MTPDSRELLLLRHAKSDWGEAGLADHERPLNPRGLRDAPRMGAWLRKQGWLPDELLSSPARRARQTLGLLAAEFDGPAIAPRQDPRIYDATLSDLLAALADCRGQRVLLVGHNPGLEELAGHLLGSSAPREMPTCCLLRIALPGDWSQLAAGCGQSLAQQLAREL